MTTRPDDHQSDPNDLTLLELFDAMGCAARVTELAQRAIKEDLGGDLERGDITSLACGDHLAVRAEADIAPRAVGVFAGAHAIPVVLHALAPRLAPVVSAADGGIVRPGDSVATLEGPLPEMLRAERTVLNILGRMSGVATLTRRYVEAAQMGNAAVEILGTRKTIPGWRELDQYAIRCGGGELHRLGLHDAVLLKDNHLAGVAPTELASLVRSVAERARADRPLRFVEVEVDTHDQLDALLTLEQGVVSIILLDNMGPDELRLAVQKRNAAGLEILLEASGGVTLETVAELAATGIDRVSVGAITHSAPSLDLGLDLTRRG